VGLALVHLAMTSRDTAYLKVRGESQADGLWWVETASWAVGLGAQSNWLNRCNGVRSESCIENQSVECGR
jgi:hypothetical protein